MEVSLINVNAFYKRTTSTRVPELPLCLLFLQNNQPKIALLPKGCILGWQIPLLFILLPLPTLPRQLRSRLQCPALFPALEPLGL